MTCKHLKPLELALMDTGVPISYRGRPWSENCREWVYFKCLFTDLEATMERFGIDPAIVKVHDHFGTHDGQEFGLFCTECKDGIMGRHPKGQEFGQKEVIEFI